MATQAQIDALMQSAQQIKTSIDSYAANTPPTRAAAPSPTPSVTEDPFITQLKAQLTGQAGIVSSAEKDVTELIRQAQQGIKGGAASEAARIESQYNREIGYKGEENARLLSTAQEAQRGFATNNALLRQIKTDGEKSINDLEQRKQELILSGNAQAAQTLANLQLKEAEFMVTSRQQAFQNMLSVAGFGLQAGSLNLQQKQFEQAAYQFDRQMQGELGKIALQYGIKLQAGDTLESVIGKAYPRADEMAKLALDEARLGISLKNAQIALTRAQSAQIGRESEDAKLLGDMLYKFQGTPFANMIMEGAAKGGNTGAVLQQFNKLAQPRNLPDQELNQKAIFAHASGQSIGDFIESIKTDSSIQNKARAEEIARMYYGKPKIESTFTMTLKEMISAQGGGWSGIQPRTSFSPYAF